MVDTVVPYASDVAWGEYPYQLFDYYRHPTRDATGNPLIIIHHGNGWIVGSHRNYRTSSSTEYFHFLRWLSGDDSSTAPARHWDVCSFTSGQLKHNAIIPRSRQMFGQETVLDGQLGIASIKSMHATYGFNPRKIIVAGESAGAVTVGNGQLNAPLVYKGYDSKARGMFYSEGPIDLQQYLGVDYMHYSRVASFVGASETSSTEYDSISQADKAKLSIIQFFRDGRLAHYPGFYVAFTQGGDGVKPLGDAGHAGSDPHDSIQLTDLTNAMGAAGVQFGSQLITAADLLNTSYPSTTAAALAVFRPIELWMSTQVAITE